MAEAICVNEDKYLSKDGRCCDRCHAGFHMKAECNAKKRTECVECRRGLYTARKNHLSSCYVCLECSHINNQRKVKECTAQENTVCECLPGFYCNNDQCDYCIPVSVCRLGEGVKVKATQTHDTVCAPCEEGTYSNITDFHSACRSHTRCEEIGRVTTFPGTRTNDTTCGDFISHCHWMLPTGLWSGLVLTVLILFGLICWREKRKSYRAARSINSITLTEVVPATPDRALALSLTSTEINRSYQGSFTVDGYDLQPFHTDDNVTGGSTQDSLDSCLPITPLKASISFVKTSHDNGSAAYSTGKVLRTCSEPQEDEWYGM
ncbi:tumor necrosis factor receptor superfamily member 5 [Antennarius striatus]|uniref:tumor necrosis factor receptor superfamily member 5 n=1 Tax=Antennarius striatus TaxID=241820 RepID=UPI0035AE2FCB